MTDLDHDRSGHDPDCGHHPKINQGHRPGSLTPNTNNRYNGQGFNDCEYELAVATAHISVFHLMAPCGKICEKNS
jgi:hypothetical protein